MFTYYSMIINWIYFSKIEYFSYNGSVFDTIHYDLCSRYIIFRIATK